MYVQCSSCLGLSGTWGFPRRGYPPPPPLPPLPGPLGLCHLQRPSQSPGPFGCPEELRVIKQRSHNAFVFCWLSCQPVDQLFPVYGQHTQDAARVCNAPLVCLCLPRPGTSVRSLRCCDGWFWPRQEANDALASRGLMAPGQWGGPGRCGRCCRHQRGTAG